MSRLLSTIAVLLVASTCLDMCLGLFDKQAAIAEFTEAAEKCRADVGGAQVDIEDMIKKSAASTHEGKCLRACLMKKYQILDNNGKFVRAVAHEHAKEYLNNDAEKLKIAEAIGSACEAIDVSDDHCEAAEQYLHCFHAEAKKHGVDKFEM